ncbi:hypothetical protein [Enterococcus crotali]|uniref:hypothetical protein n=1 Tax=Enterococcus crotali TaxID=1453587 RepID=UPI00046FFE2B|nr:hypothetical protein [Enterococcus crotali]
MNNNEIDFAKVIKYIDERYSEIDLKEQNLSTAFEQKNILNSDVEISQFLIYLGYSEEGVTYYFEHDMAADIYYEVFMILSRWDLINYLNTEEL